MNRIHLSNGSASCMTGSACPISDRCNMSDMTTRKQHQNNLVIKHGDWKINYSIFSGGLMKFNGEIQENPLYTWKITKITTTGHKKSLHPENITHICLIYDHLGI